MTIKELSNYFYIAKQINHLHNKLENLEEQILGGSKTDGMPKNPNVNKPTEEIAIKILELKEIMLNKQIKLIEEMIAIEKFIDTIPDAEIQAIIRMRFIELKSWNSISIELDCERTNLYHKLKRYLARND